MLANTSKAYSARPFMLSYAWQRNPMLALNCISNLGYGQSVKQSESGPSVGAPSEREAPSCLIFRLCIAPYTRRYN